MLENCIGKIVLRETIEQQGIIHERLYCTGIEDGMLIVKDKNNNTFSIPRERVVLFGRPFATDFEDLNIPRDISDTT